MTLRSRLAKLERLTRDRRRAACEACGGELPAWESMVLLDEHHRDVSPRCPACRLPVDRAGRPERRETGPPCCPKVIAGIELDRV